MNMLYKVGFAALGFDDKTHLHFGDCGGGGRLKEVQTVQGHPYRDA